MDKRKNIIKKKTLFRRVHGALEQTGTAKFKDGLHSMLTIDDPATKPYLKLASRIRPDNASEKMAANKITNIVVANPWLLPYLNAYLNTITCLK